MIKQGNHIIKYGNFIEYPLYEWDLDAIAFINSAGLTNITHKLAINQLVLDLKANSLWSDMIAIYPFIGGTASSHKWNLKDPRDLDAAYRLTFSGGITHSGSGMVGNSVNGYADTKLIPATSLTLNDTSVGAYILNESAVSAEGIIGIFNTSTQLLRLFYTGIYLEDQQYSNNLGRALSIWSNKKGFTTSSNTAGLHFTMKNGLIVSQITTNGGSLPTLRNIYISAINGNNSGQIVYFSAMIFAFAYISKYLTPTKAANLYTSVQTYQTTLGRQV